MKSLYLIITMFLLTSSAIFASDYSGIVVKNYNTGKTKLIKEDSKIRAIIDGKVYKGRFQVVSDKVIAINSDTIVLGNIQELSSKTAARQVGGVVLATPSVFIGSFGIWAIGQGIADASGYGLFAIVFGTPVAAIGIMGTYFGARLIFNGKKYASSRYEYRIAEAESVKLETSISPE